MRLNADGAVSGPTKKSARVDSNGSSGTGRPIGELPQPDSVHAIAPAVTSQNVRLKDPPEAADSSIAL
jgi:hypothetical protein